MPKISALPAIGSVESSDNLPILDESGEPYVLKKVSVDVLGTYIGENYGSEVTSTTITETTTLGTGPSLYFVQENDDGEYTATLPSPSSMSGRFLIFITLNYSESGFTILPNNSESIQGGSYYAMNGPGASVTMWCDGNNWYITASASNF